jgi:hypothetical protein
MLAPFQVLSHFYTQFDANDEHELHYVADSPSIVPACPVSALTDSSLLMPSSEFRMALTSGYWRHHTWSVPVHDLVEEPHGASLHITTTPHESSSFLGSARFIVSAMSTALRTTLHPLTRSQASCTFSNTSEPTCVHDV